MNWRGLEEWFNFTLVAVLLRQHSSMPRRETILVPGFSTGKRESMWVSTQLPQSCRTLPKRLTSFSFYLEYWAVLQAYGKGTAGRLQPGDSEGIKGTKILLNPLLTPTGSTPMSQSIEMPGPRIPQMVHGHAQCFTGLPHESSHPMEGCLCMSPG